MCKSSCDSASESPAWTRNRERASCLGLYRPHHLHLLCAAMAEVAAIPHAPAATPPPLKSADREFPYQKPDKRGRYSSLLAAPPAWHLWPSEARNVYRDVPAHSGLPERRYAKVRSILPSGISCAQ